MITYTVKSGDTLSQIAFDYQTTVEIIMNDNPQIKNKDYILVGMEIKIRSSEEFAKEKVSKAKSAVKETSSNSLTAKMNLGNQPSVIGTATTLRSQPLYSIQANKRLKTVRTLGKNKSYRVYYQTSDYGGLYNVGGNQWVAIADVRFVRNTSTSTSSNSATVKQDTEVPKRTSSDKYPGVSPVHLAKPNYRRPVMQIKKPDGSTLTIELRVTSVSGSAGNNLQSNATNSGFLVNVGGPIISQLTIQAEFLDTQTNKEFNDFYALYQRYMRASKSDSYYALQICTFYYKNKEYKRLISNLNYNDTSQTPLSNKAAISFLVLREKLTTITAMNKVKKVVGSSGQTEDFYSGIANLLTNPINGELYGHT